MRHLILLIPFCSFLTLSAQIYTEISYVSKNKDTLMLINDLTGRNIANSWERIKLEEGEKKPVIIMVDCLPSPSQAEIRSSNEKNRRKRRNR